MGSTGGVVSASTTPRILKNPLRRVEPGEYETSDGKYAAFYRGAGLGWVVHGIGDRSRTATDIEDAQMMVARAIRRQMLPAECTCMKNEDGVIETPSSSCPEHGEMVDQPDWYRDQTKTR